MDTAILSGGGTCKVYYLRNETVGNHPRLTNSAMPHYDAAESIHDARPVL